jgi:hypothetical protein
LTYEFRLQCEREKTKMLGEIVGEERGKRTARRVLDVEGAPGVEVSFEADGKILGLDHHAITTYTAKVRPDGTLYGTGKGAVMTHSGESAAWEGAGVGKFGPGGSVSYRGAIYYYSSSPTLSRLNSVALVFEFETDAAGNTHGKLWEWK